MLDDQWVRAFAFVVWGLVTFGYVLAGTWALDQRGVSDVATGLLVTVVVGGLLVVLVEAR
jgi:hypothetical protein